MKFNFQRSIVKSWSTGGSGNDAAPYGDELYVASEFAQPDHGGDTASVGNNETQTVGANRTETIGAAKQTTIGGAEAAPADDHHGEWINLMSFGSSITTPAPDAMDDFML